MNKELKDIIVSSYEAKTPEVLDEIKEKIAKTDMLCEEPVMVKYSNSKKLTNVLKTIISLAAAITIFAFGMSVGGLSKKNSYPVATVSESNSYTNEMRSVNTKGTDSVEMCESETESESYAISVATVYIDVNPSIELTIDESYVVVSCEAKNEDAKAFLDGSDVCGLTYDVAFKYIVGSLYMNGYLQGTTDAMLVSVDTNDLVMYENITNKMNSVIENNGINCDVLSQTVDTDLYFDAASEYGISVGKMELIDKVIETGICTLEDVNELAGYSIRNLEDLLNTIISQQKESNEKTDTSEVTETAIETAEQIVGDTFDIIDDVIEGTGEIAGEVTKNVSSLLDTLLSPQLP